MYINKEIRDVRHYMRDFDKFANKVSFDIREHAVYNYAERVVMKTSLFIFILFVLITNPILFCLEYKSLSKDLRQFKDLIRDWLISGFIHGSIWGGGYVLNFSVKEIMVIYGLIFGVCITIIVCAIGVEKLFFMRNKKYIKQNILMIKSKVVRDFVLENKINYEDNCRDAHKKYLNLFVKWNRARSSLKDNQEKKFQVINLRVKSDEVNVMAISSELFFRLNENQLLLIINNDDFEYLNSIEDDINDLIEKTYYAIGMGNLYYDIGNIDKKDEKKFCTELFQILDLRKREFLLKEEMKNVKKNIVQTNRKRKI